jgi:peptide/nickel transport system substrate-binding protein
MLRRLLLAVCASLLAGPALAQPKTLKVVMHSDLKILDPIWTTAYIVRNHGYLIYDTLFALDAKLEPQPQMVESWTVSDDKLTWTFKLRDGLKWHDGTPVTSADVIPSIKRFTDKDVQGGLLAKVTQSMSAVDDRTFRIVLKEPFGLVLKTLAKSASVPLFVMPRRVAELPISQQLADTTGSGPFIFKKDEWKPGEKVGLCPQSRTTCRAASRRRASPAARSPSSTASNGSRFPDGQTAINALLSGEIDMIETPAHDLLPVLEKDSSIEVRVPDHARQHLRAALQLEAAAVRQPQVPPRRRIRVEPGRLPEGRDRRPALLQGMPARCSAAARPSRARRARGHPAVELRGVEEAAEGRRATTASRSCCCRPPTSTRLSTSAPVAKSLLEKGGFKVDVQSMDWQTQVSRRAKKDPVDKGGWNISMTAGGDGAALRPDREPLHRGDRRPRPVRLAIDEEIEKLRMAFARESDPKKQFALAEKVQKRVLDLGVTVPLGQFVQPMARRTTVSGNVASPVTVFWNVEKK